MQTNYKIFYKKEDIERRISLLHRQQPFSIGIIAVGGTTALRKAIDSFSFYAHNYSLFVLMFDEYGDYEALRSQYDYVTFIVFNEPANFATMANIFANECHSTYFFLCRSDLALVDFELDKAIELFQQDEKIAIVTPHLFNRLKEPIPVIQAPHLRETLIDPISFFPPNQDEFSLYPFLGLGLYERALFQRLRGFDEQIEAEYWQQLDFGIRCWLYGYPIINTPLLSCYFHSRQFVIENRTEQKGIKRVHTKALGVRVIKGKNYPRRVATYGDSKVLDEVKKRFSLYKIDFMELIERWQPTE
jgi:hypothetical protein